ncbi:PREDICTED: uncharacterized protein LOC105452312 [Wasmannia auropunctata]|uniref:uncharacterized protein LOC105452312 n=1 Tax=Wasmannia auropunctata TaxID=64793 RepID=UPI0005EF4BDD|nr:PREDICTED: uncharacterized protein LOC105452312 [Wasmannia auropunctata]
MEECSNSSSRQRETSNMLPESDTARHATRKQEAVSYLKRKGIHDIVDFLLGELLVRRPHDPYEYLVQLLDRRILARDGLVDSPPPFSSQNIIRQARQADPLKLLKMISEEIRKF